MYREIVPDTRLEFTWGAVGGTRMSLTQYVPATMPDAEVAEWLAKGIRDGWSTTIDRLVPATA